MAKKKETGVLPSVKEETLNQIVKAQKEKIEVLTDYGRKLKKQLKECKQESENDCDELSIAFNDEIANLNDFHRKTLIIAIAIAFLLGVIIGFTI